MYKLLSLLFVLLPLISFSQAWNKVESDLRTQVESNPDALYEVSLFLTDQVDIQSMKLELQREKANLQTVSTRLLGALQTKASTTQPAVLAKIANLSGVDQDQVHTLWAANAVLLFANSAAIQEMSTWDAVHQIELLPKPVLFEDETTAVSAPSEPNGSEPGLRAINAHKMWAMGYTGYGTKVLVVDSGHDHEHLALRSSFWGNNVPIEQAWSGLERPAYCDDHGTMVTGVTVGLDRITNDTVGVAPDARWFAGPISVDCSLGQSFPNSARTLEWALDPDGDINTISDRPDVINNSWGNTNDNCPASLTFSTILNTLEAVGISVVWAVGNSGSAPSTIFGFQNLNTSLVNTFTVGSVNSENLSIASSSSRGPSNCPAEGSLAIKPEVSAPGVRIRTTRPGGSYQAAAGTSFSSPHVAGALLLLKEAFPQLAGTDMMLALYFSARDLGAAGEDNAYGMGIIDVFAAYNYLIDQGHTPTPPVTAIDDVILVDLSVDRVTNCLGAVENKVIFENNGATPLQSIRFDYYISGDEVHTESFQWQGNLAPDQTTTITLPAYEGLAPGEYELVVEAHLPNGQVDKRKLNNVVRQYIEILDEEYVQAATNASIVCRNAQVVLSNTTPLLENQTAQWFNHPERFSLISEEPVFLSDRLTDDQIFYADIKSTYRVGKATLDNNSRAKDEVNGLVFNALRDFTLISVKVFAEGGGIRNIRVLDDAGTSIANKLARVQAGENEVELNFYIPEGTNYFLSLQGGGTLRTDNSTFSGGFPHRIPGVLRISRSLNSISQYFYFYDWKVSTQHPCGRTAVAVEIDDNQSATPTSFTASTETLVLDQGNSISFTNTSNNSIQQTWDFGDGTSSTDPNPTHEYNNIGIYFVTLTVEDTNGCQNSALRQIEVTQSVNTAVEDVLTTDQWSVFPNPTSNQITIQLQQPSRRLQGQLIDLFGRSTNAPLELHSARVASIDLSHLPNGIYYLQLNIDGKQGVRKIVKTN